jgi:ABC-type amino acid transport substrate-binding protein
MPEALPILFRLLEAKRYDYLPLGIGEIDTVYETAIQKHPGLSIVDNLIIYYPYPVNLIISHAKPELAKRIQYALVTGRHNGAMEALFQKHFQTLLDTVDIENSRIIAIPNPHLDENQNLEPQLLRNAQLLD